jgi:glyceraldehyde 3-phosphate dehydrogenase
MSQLTFGINGFGRIGRTAFRVWWERFGQFGSSQIGAINTSGSSDVEAWAHLLKYDSNYGVWDRDVKVHVYRSAKDATDELPEIGTFELDGPTGKQVITITAQRDPAKIPWSRYGVETVIESTGAFVSPDKAGLHFEGGANHVVISAPGKGDGITTSVLGVDEWNILQASTGKLRQDQVLDRDGNQVVISNASCTTNCVGPVSQIMVDTFGVKKAMLTTIHAYTDDQNLQDNSHKDLRRARSAAKNIVPTSTGAARATALVIPELKGVFDGLAIRVPVSTGSLSDLTFVTSRPTTVEEVNAAFENAANLDRWRGILAVTRDPIVSNDIIGRPESAIVDLELTQVIDGDLVKVVAWYDNEWGYCNRLIELVHGFI